MDLVMPRLDGVGAMRELRTLAPGSRVIVLTSFLDDERLMPAIQAGAAGYLLKDVEPAELARAVRGGSRRRGDARPDRRGSRSCARSPTAPRRPRRSTPERLTRREHEVLTLIARGRSNKRIAFELGISEKTVKTHVGHVLAKLGVADRTQAALLAVQRGARRLEVLGPIAPGKRAAPTPTVGCMPHSNHHRSLARPRPGAGTRARRQRDWTLVIDARGAADLRARRPRARQLTEVAALPGDVPTTGTVSALVDAAGERIDVLVNNAELLGPSPQPELARYPLAELERVYAVNVFAPLALAQLALPRIADGGAIVNVTSDAAVEPYEGWGGYGSSKAALEQLTAILAAEQPALRVYAVDPGDMRTQMHQDAFPGEDISDRPRPEESVPGLVELITGSLPSGRYRARDVGARV